jgi:hypothetical protein
MSAFENAVISPSGNAAQEDGDMRLASILVAFVSFALSVGQAHSGTSVLFIGNSFTFGFGSAVRFYRADTVTDLNNEGIGGVPALFKSFTAQAGLDYDVSLETRGGSGFEFHLDNKLGIATSRQLADFLRSRNPNAELYLMATWSRADQTYPQKGAWYGKPIEAMARDVRLGNDKAAAGAGIRTVIPVGEAWTRAMQTGVADPNPYDGIDTGKLDLWTYDHYHASAAGYYLEALVVFGTLTGRDPRSLGDNECSAYELGLDRPQVRALQQVAFDQLATGEGVTPAPLVLPKPVNPERCVHGR